MLVHYVITKAMAYRGYAVTGAQSSFSFLKPSVERLQRERGERENRWQLSEVSGGSIRRVGLTLPFTNTRVELSVLKKGTENNTIENSPGESVQESRDREIDMEDEEIHAKASTHGAETAEHRNAQSETLSATKIRHKPSTSQKNGNIDDRIAKKDLRALADYTAIGVVGKDTIAAVGCKTTDDT